MSVFMFATGVENSSPTIASGKRARMDQMGFWKKSGGKAPDKDSKTVGQEVPKLQNASKTFHCEVASDIHDDCMTLEISRGQPTGTPEMGVTVLWDDKYEIHPSEGKRTYTSSEVAELLDHVVPFVIETVRNNLIDRVVYPQFHKEEYRKPLAE